MEPNTHKVPKSQWKRWGEPQRFLFNSLYEFVLHNPNLMTHPRSMSIHPDHWKTIAWNSAWMAADFSKTKKEK